MRCLFLAGWLPLPLSPTLLTHPTKFGKKGEEEKERKRERGGGVVIHYCSKMDVVAVLLFGVLYCSRSWNNITLIQKKKRERRGFASSILEKVLSMLSIQKVSHTVQKCMKVGIFVVFLRRTVPYVHAQESKFPYLAPASLFFSAQ